MSDPEEWIDPAISEREAHEAWCAMEAAQSAEEAEAVYDAYGRRW